MLESSVIVVLFILTGLVTGYMAQVIIERFRVASQASLKEGRDTSTDKTVTLIPSYQLPWPPPKTSGVLLSVAATALLFLFYFSFKDLSLWGLLTVVGSLPFLLLLGVIDTVSYRLPFPVTFSLLGWQAGCLVAVGVTSGYWGGVSYGAAGALTYAGFLLVVYVASAGNLGFGDVALGLPLGALLGAPAVSAVTAVSNALYGLLLGSVLMAAAFLVLRLMSPTRGAEGAMGRRYAPFGPNLIVGALVLLLLVF